jgi:hypothetical protein
MSTPTENPINFKTKTPSISKVYPLRFSRTDDYDRTYLQLTEPSYHSIKNFIDRKGEGNEKFKSCLHTYDSKYFVVVRPKKALPEKIVSAELGFLAYEFTDEMFNEKIQGIRCVVRSHKVNAKLDRYNDDEPWCWSKGSEPEYL